MKPDPVVVDLLCAGHSRGTISTQAEREAAVKRLTARGYTEAEIALRLRVTPRTVGRIRERLRSAEATR